jgi:hypothetical protein
MEKTPLKYTRHNTQHTKGYKMWRLLQTNTQTKEIQHTHSATLGQQKNKNAAATFKEIKMIWLFEFI